MVEVEEEITEVSVTMTKDEAIILLRLIGRMGPKQVEMVKDGFISKDEIDVDQTMEVIYEFYNTLYDAAGIRNDYIS
jgi:hypothetical protein